MNSTYTFSLEKVGYDSVDRIGGKAASLGEMLRAGIPVPPGYVIITEAYEHGMSDELKQAVLTAFDKLAVPRVAVRSSAIAEDSKIASWAGQLESYLNVDRKHLIDAVDKCWDSIKSEHATKYAQEQGIDDGQNKVAVIVQAMVNSDVSGVIFTANPVTGNRNEILIEAAYGLGELLVQGEITPETLTVSKDGTVINRRVSKQREKLIYEDGTNKKVPVSPQDQIVDDHLLKQLIDVANKIALHYDAPQDIEWAVESNRLFVVQSRPITTLEATMSVKQFTPADYILSFWAQGVSVFVTDVHVDVYRELEALFIIDDGMFKQYFTKTAFERALRRGMQFYGDRHAFDDYKADLTAHIETFSQFYKTVIEGQTNLPLEITQTFCKYTVKLCKDYTKMNFEFTDQAFSEQSHNSTISANLAKAAKFKDVVRGYMNAVLFEPDGYAAEFFRILGAQFNVKPSVLENLTQAELFALYDGKMPNKSKVARRQHAFVESHMLNQPVEGVNAERILADFRVTTQTRNHIKGQAASRGVARGPVKIIPVDYGDHKRVNEAIKAMHIGDVLVAETTAPELMLACKKAAAIVTDMGGLLSHAAIVSRELGIPCVVGTMNASKILQDGTNIRVDGDQGTVEVLK